MVDKLKKLIRRVESQRGPITLFMLWKDAQDISKWSIVVSAPWLDRMGQRLALNFWIKNLQSNLNAIDLNGISRVSVIKTSDSFVQYLVRTLNISGGAVRFTQNQLGNYFIYDAIIFEAKGLPTPNAPLTSSSRNPAINGTINPNINGTINPHINGTINPNINGTINPHINPNFDGLILYDLSLNRTSYFVEANNEILIMYDFTNTFIGFAVRAKADFYVVYDSSQNWIGYLVSNKSNGYNYFSINAEWIGFVV